MKCSLLNKMNLFIHLESESLVANFCNNEHFFRSFVRAIVRFVVAFVNVVFVHVLIVSNN